MIVRYLLLATVVLFAAFLVIVRIMTRNYDRAMRKAGNAARDNVARKLANYHIGRDKW